MNNEIRNKTNLGLKKMAYSLHEAAILISCSVGHLRNEQQRGRISFVKSGRRILVTANSLEKYLQEQVVEPTVA